MPVIKTKLDPLLASEQTVTELVQAAAAAAPGTIPKATVTRDANGRLVSVDVGLPTSVAANDLETAAAAINNNRGVATAKAFPALVINPLDTLVQDQVYTELEGGITLPTFTGFGLHASNWQGAAPDESFSGTGSALRHTDAAFSNFGMDAHWMTAYLNYSAASNGFSTINAWEVEFHFKRSPTKNGQDLLVNVDVNQTHHSVDLIHTNNSMAYLSISQNSEVEGGPKYRVINYMAAGFPTVDLDAALFSWIHVKASMSATGQFNAVITPVSNPSAAVTVTHDFGFPQAISDFSVASNAADGRFSGVGQQPPIIIDNLGFSAVSGSL